MNQTTLEDGMELERQDKLATYEGDDRVVDSEVARDEIKRTAKARTMFNTGIESLDQLVQGVRGGEMVVVGGRRKNGKTLLCQTLTANFEKQRINSLWFSYEVPMYQFLEQMDEKVMFYLPRVLTKNALDWIEDRVIEGLAKHNTRAVFIDHLHYLIDMARMRNSSLEIGAIVRRLKRMAIERDVVVFLISHVRGIDKGVEVTEDHLRDSALTSAEADTTWIVSRLFDKDTDEASNLARVSVRNHRRTGVMAKSVRLEKSGRYFTEILSQGELV